MMRACMWQRKEICEEGQKFSIITREENDELHLQ
jgi:hypothetical protein